MAEYIEREALVAKVRPDDPSDKYEAVLISDVKKMVRNLVSSVPAADVAPVVHGYNTGRCRIFHCSECGYGVTDIFQKDEHNYPVGEFNYCPNCGAKMDGGSDG